MKTTAAEIILKRLENSGEVPEARKNLVTHVLKRKGEVENEMRDYRAVRSMICNFMDGKFQSRVTARVDDIFNKLNQTLGVVRSEITFTVARTCDDVFGSTPYVAVSPEGVADEVLAEKMSKHFDWKLRQSKFAADGKDAIERCFCLGESIFRTGWRKDVRKSYQYVKVWAVGDKPLIAADGDFFYETDAIVSGEPEPGGVASAEGGQPGMDMAEGAPAEPQAMAEPPAPVEEEAEPPAEETDGASAPGTEAAETGAGPVFGRDPSVTLPGNAKLIDWLIPEERVIFDGLDRGQIDFRNWFCPPSLPRIEDADMRGHTYEMRLSDVRKKLEAHHGIPLEKMDDEVRAMFDRLKAGDTKTKDETRTGGSDPAGAGGDDRNPIVRAFDCEVEYDPRGEGDTSLFFCTIFTDTEDLFFVDFLNNVLPAGESLYTVISIYNALNRWAGRGWYELFADVMEDSDRLWCEMRHEMGMAANPMIGTHEDALDDMHISEVQFRSGATVPLLDGKAMKDFMDPYVQPDTSNLRMKVLEFRMRIHELETGATSPARGDIAGQPSNATATGTQSILASGTTLQKLPADAIKEGFECLMSKEIALLYAAQDKAETFAYGEGENTVLLTLTPEDVRGLAVNVRVLMTRFKDRENATNTKAALDVRAQYLAEPPAMQATGRKFYIQLAKALGVQNADELFPPPVPPDPDAVPVQDASERVNFNLKDMPPSTQAAALQGIGLPADAAEIAAMQEKAKPAASASKFPAK